MNRVRPRILLIAGGLIVFFSGWLIGQQQAQTQKTLLWAAAWTELDTMTPQDFDRLKKETAGLVNIVPGLRRVWVGKLLEPKTFDGVERHYGMVLEFDDVKSKNTYSANYPSPWREHFNSMRVPRSTNFDLVGE